MRNVGLFGGGSWVGVVFVFELDVNFILEWLLSSKSLGDVGWLVQGLSGVLNWLVQGLGSVLNWLVQSLSGILNWLIEGLSSIVWWELYKGLGGIVLWSWWG